VSVPTSEVLGGRYRLEGLLGTGGMGEVHRAWDTRLRRFVAVKLFHAGLDATANRRFDSEVRTLAALSHPGLVSVYDAGIDGSAPFVVLQLVNGRTLRDRINDGPLSPDEVRPLGAHLAEALAYVHANEIVHRDVKPSNILLDGEDTAYLADFGLARLTGATRLTGTGEMMGTAAYLAPEQVRGREVDCPADVYALGLVLLECLTGRPEYQGSDVESAVARLHRPPNVPRDLPEDLARLLTRMTALTPRRRPTAAQCAQTLRKGVVPLRDTRTRRGILVATAVTAVALTGGAWLLTGDPTTSAPPPRPGATSSSPEQPAATSTTPVTTTASEDPATGQVPAPGAPAVVTTVTVPAGDDAAETTKEKKNQGQGREKSAEHSPTKKNGG